MWTASNSVLGSSTRCGGRLALALSSRLIGPGGPGPRPPLAVRAPGCLRTPGTPGKPSPPRTTRASPSGLGAGGTPIMIALKNVGFDSHSLLSLLFFFCTITRSQMTLHQVEKRGEAGGDRAGGQPVPLFAVATRPSLCRGRLGIPSQPGGTPRWPGGLPQPPPAQPGPPRLFPSPLAQPLSAGPRWTSCGSPGEEGREDTRTVEDWPGSVTSHPG